MKSVDTFGRQKFQHIQSHRFRLIAREGFVTVREAPEIGSDEAILPCKLTDDWQKFTVVLRPTVHTEHYGSFTSQNIVEIHSVYSCAFADVLTHSFTP